MSFGDIRSTLNSGDVPALLEALEDYQGNPQGVMTYVRDHLGYLPASYWVCEKRRKPSLKESLGFSTKTSFQAFLSIGEEPFRVGYWSKPLEALLEAFLAIKRRLPPLITSQETRVLIEGLLPPLGKHCVTQDPTVLLSSNREFLRILIETPRHLQDHAILQALATSQPYRFISLLEKIHQNHPDISAPHAHPDTFIAEQLLRAYLRDKGIGPI